jgi:hypothetical protein
MPIWTAPKLPPPAKTKAVFGFAARGYGEGFEASAIAASPLTA